MEEIEKIIGYSFKNKDLLNLALTHSSFAHKHNIKNNERLEFLGDSILGFVVADFLTKKFLEDEGKLTKLRACMVSCEHLSGVISKFNLEKYIKTSPEELRERETVKGDFFEALLGAIYLDSDLETAKTFIFKMLELNKQKVLSVFNKSKDFKTELQEKVQADKGKVEYRLLNITGEENAKIFEMELLINEKVICSAKASSKQKAENKCAEMALKKI